MKLNKLVNDAKSQATKSSKMLSDDDAIAAAENLVTFLLSKNVVKPSDTAELRKTEFGSFILKIGKRILGPYVPYKDGSRSFKTKAGYTDKRFEIWKSATPVEW